MSDEQKTNAGPIAAIVSSALIGGSVVIHKALEKPAPTPPAAIIQVANGSDLREQLILDKCKRLNFGSKKPEDCDGMVKDAKKKGTIDKLAKDFGI